jgi:hypothetical protein
VDDNDDLLDQFQRALVSENVAGVEDCISRLTAATEGKPAAVALFQLMEQLDVLLTFHGDLVRRWADGHPEFREALRGLIDFLEGAFPESEDGPWD